MNDKEAAKQPADKTEGVTIPDHGITDAEMWADVDDYLCHQTALKLLQEACPSVFLTNRARLTIANAFAPIIREHATLTAEADKLRADLDTARQALEHYADRDRWTKLNQSAQLFVQYWGNGSGYNKSASALAEIGA